MDTQQPHESIPSRMARLAGGRDLPTTRWELVANASARTTEGRAALTKLVNICWYPLYAYARRRGKSAALAEELTQGFLTRLIQGDSFVRAAPRLEAEATVEGAETKRTRFRPWLLHSFRKFLISDWNANNPAPRPDPNDALSTEPRPLVVSIDSHEFEGRYANEANLDEDAAEFYERLWLRSALFHAHDALRFEWYEAGKGARFEALKQGLEQPMTQADYERFAPEFGTSPGALKEDAYRLRRRFRTTLRSLLDEEPRLPSRQ